MKSSIPDLVVQRRALLDQRLDADGLARWARDLVEASALTAKLQADVRVGTPPVEWSVEVSVAGRPVVLVDVNQVDRRRATARDQAAKRASQRVSA